MNIVKEKVDIDLLAKWSVEFGLDLTHYDSHRCWVVDRDRKSFLVFRTQDREFNEYDSIFYYYDFFFNGKIKHITLERLRFDEFNNFLYKIVNKENISLVELNEMNDFGLSDCFTIYKQYSDVFNGRKINDAICKIVY